MGRGHKYRAVATVVDGHKFPSKAEARRYSELKLLERAGDIRGLSLQPRFDLTISGVNCGFYKADFAYFRGEDRIVEDVKGVETPIYRLKKKIVEALYSVKITEISKTNPADWKTTLAYQAQKPCRIETGFPQNGMEWTEDAPTPNQESA